VNALRRSVGYAGDFDAQFIIHPQQNFRVPCEEASIRVWAKGAFTGDANIYTRQFHANFCFAPSSFKL